MYIHSSFDEVFEVLLIISWKTDRRKNILITLTGYVAVLVVTGIYFVPELMEITETPYSTLVDAALTARTKQWEVLSLLRLSVLICIGNEFVSGTYQRW